MTDQRKIPASEKLKSEGYQRQYLALKVMAVGLTTLFVIFYIFG